MSSRCCRCHAGQCQAALAAAHLTSLAASACFTRRAAPSTADGAAQRHLDSSDQTLLAAAPILESADLTRSASAGSPPTPVLGGAIEAMRPYSFGENEAAELRALIERWRSKHPDVQVDLAAD